jgi:CheY-like chemotaxis protein
MVSRSPHLRFASTKVLAVDDNSQAMEILSGILLGFGIQSAVKCRTAEEAMEKLDYASFDVVVIDDDMPGMDGFDLIDHIRRDPKSRNYTAPIILASANPYEAQVTRARDHGANLVISKPIVPGALLARMIWLARSTRAFVTSDGYRGPDRRFKAGAPPAGAEERRSEHLSMLAAPERALSQEEINSLF